MRGQLDWKPSIHFRANIGYEINDADLPHGDFVTRQARAKIDWVFSSKLSWVNLGSLWALLPRPSGSTVGYTVFPRPGERGSLS